MLGKLGMGMLSVSGKKEIRAEKHGKEVAKSNQSTSLASLLVGDLVPSSQMLSAHRFQIQGIHSSNSFLKD